MTVSRGYDVYYKDKALYVKVRGTLPIDLLFLSTCDGNVSIPNKYGEINAIYLAGDNPSENVRIWPKTEKN